MGISLKAVKKVPKRKLLSELKYSEKQAAYWQQSIDELNVVMLQREKNVAYHQAFIDAINAELPLRRTRPRKNQGI